MSLTVAPVARPAALTSSSGIGGDHTARLAAAVWPVTTVRAPGGVNISLATAAALSQPVAATSPSREGCATRLRPEVTAAPVTRHAVPATAPVGSVSGASSLDQPRRRSRGLSLSKAGSGASSVNVWNTWAIATPSATLWCTRINTAQPAPYPSMRYTCHNGLVRSIGTLIRSLTKSCSASWSPGAGSARWWRWFSSAKCGVVLPLRRDQRQPSLGDPLPQPRVPVDPPGCDALRQDVPVQRRVEPHHRVDHHQVGRPVHAQPRGIRGGHPLATAHAGSPRTGPAAAGVRPRSIPRSPRRSPEDAASVLWGSVNQIMTCEPSEVLRASGPQRRVPCRRRGNTSSISGHPAVHSVFGRVDVGVEMLTQAAVPSPWAARRTGRSPWASALDSACEVSAVAASRSQWSPPACMNSLIHSSVGGRAWARGRCERLCIKGYLRGSLVEARPRTSALGAAGGWQAGNGLPPLLVRRRSAWWRIPAEQRRT